MGFETDIVVDNYGLFYSNRGSITGPYQGFSFQTLGGASEAKQFFEKKSKKKLHVRRSAWTRVS